MSNQDDKVLCPRCPLCGAEPPYIIPTLAQAICPSDDCPVILWEPWASKDANLASMGKIRVFENGVEITDDREA